MKKKKKVTLSRLLRDRESLPYAQQVQHIQKLEREGEMEHVSLARQEAL